jgi:DNA-binding transcriptional regulator YhcF (GntR family)
MTIDNIYRLVRFDEHLAMPKSLQIINCIVRAVQEGSLQKDYLLPSINDFSYELNISRSTVQRAYEHLKRIGVIDSFPGKGYFINDSRGEISAKVFVLFDNLSAHNKIIYDAFVTTLGKYADIDFYIYNNDFDQFKKMLQRRKEDFDHYVIIPHFFEGGKQAVEAMNQIPNEKLILLDQLLPDMKGQYGAVYENFGKNIYTALEAALPHLVKYETLTIIRPSKAYFPNEIFSSLHFFCQKFGFDYNVVYNLEEVNIHSGELFISLIEDDLFVLLSKIKNTSLQIGKDIGVICHEETPWMEFILNGISTMSADFRKMGEMAANMILKKENAHLNVPFTFVLRNSI